MSASVIHVTSQVLSNTASPWSVTIPSTTAGNTLIIVIQQGGENVGDTAISSISGAGTWTQDESQSQYGAQVDIWECPNISGGTTSLSVTNAYSNPITGNADVFEVSGLLSTGAFDNGGVNNGTSSPATTNSLTPSGAGEFFVAGYAYEYNNTSGATTGLASGGWTDTYGSTGVVVDSAYLIASGSGAESTSWTINAGGGTWTTATACYKLTPAASYPNLEWNNNWLSGT